MPGEVGDPHPFGIVVTDPSDRPVDVGKVAVRQADLPDHITERAGEQPPEISRSTSGASTAAGITVDGETSAVYPPLLESDVRY